MYTMDSKALKPPTGHTNYRLVIWCFLMWCIHKPGKAASLIQLLLLVPILFNVWYCMSVTVWFSC